MNKSDYSVHLKSEFHDLPIDTIFRSPVTVINGITSEAAFWNALGQSLTGGISNHHSPEFTPDPSLLAAEGHFIPPGVSGLAWPEEMDSFPPFYLSLAALDDNFFIALNVPKSNALGLSVSDFNDLINAYWMRRFDLKTNGKLKVTT